MIKRLGGAVDLACSLRVARESVYKGRFLAVHVSPDHRYLSFSLAFDFFNMDPVRQIRRARVVVHELLVALVKLARL